MKLIFLDIDGVLNSYAPTTIKRKRQFDYAPECIGALEFLLRESGARIVLSSSWRGVITPKEAQEDLRALGATSAVVIGATPQLESLANFEARKDDLFTGLLVAKSRGDEIEEWLFAFPCPAVVVLDDYCDQKMKAMPHVQTDYNTGLTMDDARRAADLLGRAP